MKNVKISKINRNLANFEPDQRSCYAFNKKYFIWNNKLACELFDLKYGNCRLLTFSDKKEMILIWINISRMIKFNKFDQIMRTLIMTTIIEPINIGL